MTDLISKSHSVHPTSQPEARLFDTWIETGVRERVRDWIEALIKAELAADLPSRWALPHFAWIMLPRALFAAADRSWLAHTWSASGA
jgi:hypothetical protein